MLLFFTRLASLFRHAAMPRQGLRAGTLLLLTITGVEAAHATPVIEEIRISGNETTRPRIILQEMVVRVGDPVDPVLIEKSRQAIMDLGLFKSVEALLKPGQKGQILEIRVTEKYYFFPIPKLKRSPEGEVSYGAQIRFDNLAGLNQRLKLTYQTERDCCTLAGNRNSTSLDYEYPRFRGSHYDLSLGLGYSTNPADVSENDVILSEFEELNEKANIKVRTWLDRTGPSSGWSISGGWFWNNRRYDYVSGLPGTDEPGHAAGLTFNISNYAVHDYLFSRGGSEYGYELQLALERLGSDSGYSLNRFYYRRYWPVGQRMHQNLNFQLEAGFSNGTLVFGDYAFALGGADDLRGHEKNSIEGNSFFTFNVEYLTPLFDQNAFRGVIFADIGNAYPDNRIIDPGDIEAGLGLGFRIKLKSFVNVQIRADIAIDPATSERKTYIGTKNTF